MIIGLLTILILVLILPFLVHRVERNLEIFLFIMGIAAVLVSGELDWTLISHALMDPIKITIAVLIAGLLFKWFARPFERSVAMMSRSVSPRLFLALVVMILGILSSVITAIIAALVLVAIVSILQLDRRTELVVVVISCFSIGLGAALTPIGEPLSTIATSKLNESFFFLAQLLGGYIVLGIAALGVLTFWMVKPKQDNNGLESGLSGETYKEVIIRTTKIYVFVMALTLLGSGFETLITMYLLEMSPYLLYWINIISAVLDNATLTAAEISPAMSTDAVRDILLGLLISGGILIPGNIPNIIAAGKLKITSKEWARIGVPIGLSLMLVYFIVILIVNSYY